MMRVERANRMQRHSVESYDDRQGQGRVVSRTRARDNSLPLALLHSLHASNSWITGFQGARRHQTHYFQMSYTHEHDFSTSSILDAFD
jgi:hypothetical protein